MWVEKERALIYLPLIIETPVPLDEGHALMNSFNRNHLLKTLSPDIVTLGVKAFA